MMHRRLRDECDCRVTKHFGDKGYPVRVAKFPLKFGSAAHPIRYGGGAPSSIGKFEIDPMKEYPVTLWAETVRGEHVGRCRVGGEQGSFWVEPDFKLNFPDEDCTFYASWDVDDSGVAHLEEVFLVAKGIG